MSQDAMEVVNAEANTRRFVLKGLSVFTRYWIRVLGFTSVGTGKSSDLVVASTDEDGESLSLWSLVGFVAPVRGTDFSSTVIEINIYWQKLTIKTDVWATSWRHGQGKLK